MRVSACQPPQIPAFKLINLYRSVDLAYFEVNQVAKSAITGANFSLSGAPP